MRTNHLKKTLFCLLAAIVLFALCGCGDKNNQNIPEVDSISVSISVDYPVKAKMADLKTLPFRAEEDSSVLQVVELFGNVNDISILVDTTYSTLEGIDGVINHVTLKAGTWQYKINGKLKDKPINDVVLKDGDHLELVYVKEPQ